MKSQAAWDEANKFSANLMIGAGIFVSIIQLILFFIIDGHLKILLPITLLLILLVAIIPITEVHLKKHFDKEGNVRT